jgi:L,D-peptidoglycan transpeptidase YkuD (ErfK/YbiS/YcfS/YnhG family)
MASLSRNIRNMGETRTHVSGHGTFRAETHTRNTETHTPLGVFRMFRCFGHLPRAQSAIAPGDPADRL